MKTSHLFIIRLLVTALALAAAIPAACYIWNYYMAEPWTRDGRVCAEVVRLAPDVSGLVTDIPVADNEVVKKGQVIFRVDQARFGLALQSAEASLANSQAVLDHARHDLERYQHLGVGVVSQEKLEEVVTAASQAEAACQRAQADCGVARLNLARSEIKSPVNGTLANFTLRTGDYITAGQAVTALVDNDSYYVTGYFEETKLPRIRLNAPVTIRLMGAKTELTGRVASIAAGIEDRERTDSTRLLANVNPTFSWVRLPQRIPVRIALDKTPPGIRLVAGQTATVIVQSEPHQ